MTVELSLKEHIQYLCKTPRTPHSKGYFESQEFLKGSLKGIGLRPETHDFSVWGLGTCTNIYGERILPGKPLVLVGAHYDSFHKSGAGADDNASAVAAVIEIAKILHQSDVSYVAVFFDMEELYGLNFLRGSGAFAKFYKRPLDRVVIFDLVGGVFAPEFENTYMQFGNGFQKLSDPHLEFLHLPMKVVEPMGPIYPRSDYHGFRNRRIPHTFFTSGTPWYYHTQFDTPEIIRFDKLAHFVNCIARHIIQNTAHASLEEWDDFYTFLEKLSATPQLKNSVANSLIKKRRVPNRLELLRLYAHILGGLRREGKNLWSKAS